MKIRSGFVSNSSSSSFLCIGVNDGNIIKKLLKAENPKKEEGELYYQEEWGGTLTGNNVCFYGSREDVDEENLKSERN